MKIALITEQGYPVLVGGDRLLIPALEKYGIDAVPTVWTDPMIDWSSFDCVVLRSCWDYYTDIDRFNSWLAQLENLGVWILNPPELIEWNLNKKYLFDLQDKGIRIPVTTLIPRGDSRPLDTIWREFNADTIVAKPCYGASAYGVMKIDGSTAKDFEMDYRKLVAKTDMLIQAFIPEISEGEFSAVFIGGELSHVVLKKPKSGEFRSNGGFGATRSLAILNLGVTARVIDIYDQCDVRPLFARLDFVLVSSEPILMELELIEPYLFFELKEDSADRFALNLGQFSS